MKRILTAVSRFFTHSFLWLGIGSILWLLVRSGTKPSRLRYPCQRAAAGTGSLWLGAFVFPGILRGLRAIGLNLPEVRLSRPARSLLLVAGLSAVSLLVAARLVHQRPVVPLPARANLPIWTSARPTQDRKSVV
jgi:hypothetical protein